ncbi:MAG: DNA repair protein RecN [Pacificimonas sp.]
MLTALSIRDVLLIEALDLDMGRGLTVLTGETGAGKSILLDSLGLALGARADSGLVRGGTTRAEVSASFVVDDRHPVRDLLAAQDIECDHEIMLRRTVKADGGSRAFVDGHPVPVALLRDVGTSLVEIHGQHDERGLLDPKGHRDLLDLFGGLAPRLSACRHAHVAWREAVVALNSQREEIEAAARDREYLEHSVEEIAAFAPQPGEDAELAGERTKMLAGQKAAEDMSLVSGDLQGSKGGLAKLRSAARRLERVAELHSSLSEALGALDRALVETDEAERHLGDAERALAYDVQHLDAAEERLFDLRALARKHRVQPDDLAALLEDMQRRIAAIDEGDRDLARLEKDVETTRAAFVSAAERLTQARTTAAARLDKAMAAELPPLKLEAARFRTVVDPLSETQWGPNGADRVAFEIATNPGSDFGPLIKIASGGELSRFILALKVALAAAGAAGTMIFDEIDRGVGGATASAIGDRLSRLAGEAQVVVVTHSPQVAARGAAHLKIQKSASGTVARTDVSPLSLDERREEIARMLSAEEVTDEARAQALRLLDAA